MHMYIANVLYVSMRPLRICNLGFSTFTNVNEDGGRDRGWYPKPDQNSAVLNCSNLFLNLNPDPAF